MLFEANASSSEIIEWNYRCHMKLKEFRGNENNTVMKRTLATCAFGMHLHIDDIRNLNI